MSEQQQEIVSKPATSKSGLVLGLFAFLLVGGALGVSFYELSKVNVQLAQMVTDLKQQVAKNESDMTAMKDAVANMTATVAVAKEQNTQVDLEKWHVSEAEYLTKLADHYMQVVKDPMTATVLLQHADEVLQKSSNSSLQPLRQALQENIGAMQAQPLVNTDELYAKLIAINSQLDKLPLPITPLQNVAPMPAASNSADSKWQAGWQKAVEAFNKVVLVRKMGANDMPLVLPEEKMFLYQNLHAQMQVAMLAVLQRNPSIYKSTLQQMTAWIQKYYVQSSPLTINVLKELQEAESINLQMPEVNLGTTLQLFNQYLAANNQ